MFNIYIDGIYDLFHAGHVTTLKNIKNMRDDVNLIVGVVNDNDAKEYKRLPIINENNRYLMLESCKYVDQVVKNAPMLVNESFVNEYNIDLIVHSFYNKADQDKQAPYFVEVKRLNKFQVVDYSNNDSTSRIIERIKNNY